MIEKRVTVAFAGIRGFTLVAGSSVAGIVLLDFVLGPRTLNAAALTGGLGLAFLFGATCALAAGLLVRATARLRWLWAAFSLGGALGTTALLLTWMNVLERLTGPRASLALVAAAACIAVGITVLLSLMILPSLLGHDRGRASYMPRNAILGLSITLTAALAFAAVDRWLLFPGLYLPVHRALHFLVLLQSTCALGFALEALGWRSQRIGDYVGSALLCLIVGAALLATGALRSSGEYHVLLSHSYARSILTAARKASDVDADGYSSVLGGGDCAPLASSIHPFADELAGNGVDDDCYGGDVKDPIAEPSLPIPPTEEQPITASSVVLVTIDTVRADRMSVYGASRNTTPVLKAWSKKALVFETALTPGTTTYTALPAILQGRYFARNLTQPLLPLWLRSRGYFMAALLDVGGEHGEKLENTLRPLRETFDSYETSYKQAGEWLNDESTTKRALALLAKVPADRPFFLWVHYMGPHLPDTSHPEVPSFGAEGFDRYDHEIAFADRALAPLLARLSDIERNRSLLTILTSDHGEEPFGLGRNHGATVRFDALRVPLLVRAQAIEGARIKEPVSTVDIAATILAAANASHPQLDGVDLRFVRDGQDRPRTMFAVSGNIDHWLDRPNMAAAFNRDWKVTLDLTNLDEWVSPVDSDEPLPQWPSGATALRVALAESLVRLR